MLKRPMKLENHIILRHKNKHLMKRIAFLSLLTLLFLGSDTASAQDYFLNDYKVKWQNATAYTLEFARSMPEDFYSFSPTPEEMTFGEQLKHIAGNMIWLSSSYLKGAKEHVDPSATGDSKKEIIAMLEKSFAYAEASVSALSTKAISEEVDFIAEPMSRRRVMLLMTDHVTHHRGQLVVYLRLKHVEPPKYVGW
jgi:uncharacterized damage-inducible protein DinB